MKRHELTDEEKVKLETWAEAIRLLRLYRRMYVNRPDPESSLIYRLTTSKSRREANRLQRQELADAEQELFRHWAILLGRDWQEILDFYA
jgi:hypothetical protein